MNYVSQENLDNIVRGLSNKIAMSVSNGALIGDTTPVGTVISFMGTQAPLFYLICDGTTYNIAEYQELADFIEAQFGTVNYFGGDGVDTFAVPDLRGEFLRGTGTATRNTGSGSTVGTHQDGTEIPYLYYDDNGHNFAIYNGNSGSTLADPRNRDITINGNGTLSYAGRAGTSSLNGASHYTSRPTNTSVLYCIKYTKAVIPSEYEDGTPVGRVIFDSILREGYIKANGAQIEDASISIPRLLSFVQKYSSQLIASDQATYEANVGLYMYDSNNDILTLPNYIGRFMEGGNSVESIEAGLPNAVGASHTPGGVPAGGGGNGKSTNANGVFKSSSLYGSSATSIYYYASSVKNNPSQGDMSSASLKFSLSDSNPIYGKSTTVQPSSITLIPQIRY